MLIKRTERQARRGHLAAAFANQSGGGLDRRTFLRRSGLAATTLLTLILNWNEYLFAVFLATAKVQTMPIMVAAKNAGEKGVLWWEMSAVIVIMIIPVILMAILLTRFISRGVLMGAVKG